MKGTIYKETKKLGMNWPELIQLGIIFLWKLCELEGIHIFTRRIFKPLGVELFKSEVGAEYVKTQNTTHFSKIIQKNKSQDTSYNETSKQTKWRKHFTLEGILQEIIKKLRVKGVKV